MKGKPTEQPAKRKEVKPTGKQTPVDRAKPGTKSKTPPKTTQQQAQGKNAKGGKGKQQVEQQQEERVIPPPEKEKNLERFVYVSVYSDSELMKKLKELFEQINQPAFQLRSVKEIYTKSLTPEEQDNNEINYISGFQLIDKEQRITIIEGITGQAMQKVKDALPKTQMNSATYKVFADSRVLFNQRIYSKFDLNLKYIKLRDNLNTILTTHDIYSKANKYKEIYNAFLNFGSIMKAKTMQEIAESNLFTRANDLLLLERKYADILNDEDLTGIRVDKKPKKRIRADSILDRTLLNNSSLSVESNTIISNSIKPKSGIEQSNSNLNQTDVKPERKRLDCYFDYDELLGTRHKKSLYETMRDNSNFLKTMKKKQHQNHFSQPLDSNEEVWLYSQSRNNYYMKYFDKLRDKYYNDTKNYYTYSLDALTLSFPMISDKNYQYLAYLENKKKWTSKEDFSRYQQPKRDYIYWPKINNVL